MKKIIKQILFKFPFLDGLFRRYIWSYIHFPEYEMKFFDQLKAGQFDIAIDVGAALGSYSWILNRKFKTVYAFEPGNTHYAYLQKLIFNSNINLKKVAVGENNGKVEFYTPGNDTEAFHSATVSSDNPVIDTDNVDKVTIDQISLNSFFCDSLDVGRSIDLIKIDIEGYELEAIKGADKLIIKHKPLIICEIEARHNKNYPEAFNILRSFGYECYFWRDNDFHKFTKNKIEDLQKVKDLEYRLSGEFNPQKNYYINNFIFQHPSSKIKVAE